MIALVVKKGTEVEVIRDARGVEWHIPANWRKHITKHDNIFYAEDIRIDPLGHVGNGPGNVTVGSKYAEAGYYGFERKGYIMIVHMSKVEGH